MAWMTTSTIGRLRSLILVFTCAGALSCSSRPVAPAETPPPPTMQKQAPGPADRIALLNLMAKDLHPAIKTLDQDILIFHHTQRAVVGVPNEVPLDPNDARFSRYLQNSIKSFWVTSRGAVPGEVKGLRLAIDPFATQQAGRGEDFVEFSVHLHRGHRYLDAHSPSHWSAETVALLDRFGCAPAALAPVETPPGARAVDHRTEFRNTLLTSGPAVCRDFAQQALRESAVQSIVTDLGAIAPEECNQDNDNGFILLDTRTIVPVDVHVLTREVPRPDPYHFERSMISALARRADNAYATHRSIDPWPSLLVDPQINVKAWAVQNLWACRGWH